MLYACYLLLTDCLLMMITTVMMIATVVIRRAPNGRWIPFRCIHFVLDLLI